MYTYAQILNIGTVEEPIYKIKDAIVMDDIGLADSNLITAVSAGYSFFLRVDNRNPQPAIGYYYSPETDTFLFGEPGIED